MSYEAEISRSNPSAFLFLIDMSGSMTDPYAGGKRKAPARTGNVKYKPIEAAPGRYVRHRVVH